jgi:asparagine synthase (glutamine-hydrolysing)
MVIQLDEPLADPAPLNVAFISELARSNDIKVLLSGSGGDDIFTGYRRHRALAVDQYLSLLPSSVLSYLEAMTEKLDPNVTVFRRLAKLFSGAPLKGDQRIVNYFRWIKHKDLFPLFSPSFKLAVTSDVAESPMYNFLGQLPPSLSPLDRMLALEQRFFLADHNLNYTDKMAMASGIEVRVPLLDESLMQFVDTIPDALKQKGKHGKWIFKKTMEKYLPKPIIYRSKTGFGAPLRSWLNFELRDLRENLLSTQSLSKRGIFDPAAVASLIKRNNSNAIDASYTILSLMCIEIWFRHYVDKAQSFSGI